MARLRRIIVGLLALIGLGTMLAALTVTLGGWWLVQRVERALKLPGEIVLVADLRGSLDDAAEGGFSALALGAQPRLSEVVLALDRAGRDPRVKGLVARVDDSSHGFAAAQELRDAVARFRRAGRPAIAFADSFGELGPGNEGYYLATAFDEIVLQPVGLVGLTGLMAEVPFARELLDRIGIEPAFERREAYKTALDSFTETGLTAANRAMLTRLLDDLSRQLVQGIADGRRLDEPTVRGLVDGGPYTAEEAVERQLVDRLGYWDETLAAAGPEENLVDIADYIAAGDDPPKGAAGVALVRGVGAIARGERDGLGGGSGIAADDLADDLAAAIDDPEVAAILFRVDSPGGSPVASETIARQIRRAKAAGKPVVVAMGNAAASGGYWIAMDATSIVAQPATLTGSIGVIAGKPVLRSLWEQLDVRWAQLPAAANAAMWSVNTPYSAQGRARLNDLVDALYASFKAGVAGGRSLPAERVDEIAQGKVWTGAEARELGLVDMLGGLAEAQDAVRAALGLAPGAPLAVRPYPPPRTPFARVLELLRVELAPLETLRALVAMVLAPDLARMPALQIR